MSPARPGRPVTTPNGEPKGQISMRLATDVTAHIRKQPNYAAYVESLVRDDMEVQAVRRAIQRKTK